MSTEAERDRFDANRRDDRYSLKWNHYDTCITSGLGGLLEDSEYSMTDVTLACEGNFIQAHKIVLALSSPFFKQFFKLNRVEKAGTTLIALANVKFNDLKNIIQFLYYGEVTVSNSIELSSFLATANLLQIQGLEDMSSVKTVAPEPVSQFRSSNSNLSSSILSGRTRRRLARSSKINNDSNRSRFKQARVSTSSIPENSVSQMTPDFSCSSNVVIPPTSMEDLSLMHNEDEEDMISLDDVKPVPISVYSMPLDENSDKDSRVVDADESQPLLNPENLPIEETYDSTSYNNLQFPDTKPNVSSGEPVPSFMVTNVRNSAGPSTENYTAVGNRSVSSWGTAVGRCKFCPTTPKTVSRTKCCNCNYFLCAKQTCRVYLKLKNGKDTLNVCRICASLMDVTKC